jgi:uncharacterized membrane protein YfcA
MVQRQTTRRLSGRAVCGICHYLDLATRRGSYTVETVKLYGIGLPFMIAGIWIGFRLYGTIDDETFRKAVLVLVLLAGGPLIASVSGFMPW